MTDFLISSLLTLAPALYPQVEAWFYAPSDTPAADVIRIRSPYALAKDRTRGPTPPTELVCPYPAFVMGALPGGWVRLNGHPMQTVYEDVERVTVTGNWLVSQDRRGWYHVFDVSGPNTCLELESTLDSVNAHLADVGLPPVSDADFRTFEELAEERKWRQVTRATFGLAAIAFGWLTVAGFVCWTRWLR